MADLKSVIDKAQADPKYRERLKGNAGAVLKEAGVDIPAGKTVEVIEAHRNELHLFLGTRSNVAELDRVLERAGKDAAFKHKLASDPKGAVEEATGKKLPAAVEVRLHEPEPNRVRLVLPASKDAAGELSDLELEAVAGGGFFRNVANFFCPDNKTAVVDFGTGVVTNYVDASLGGSQEVATRPLTR